MSNEKRVPCAGLHTCLIHRSVIQANAESVVPVLWAPIGYDIKVVVPAHNVGGDFVKLVIQVIPPAPDETLWNANAPTS